MDKVTFVEVVDFMSQEKQTYAIIEHEDGSQTSMLKSFYDEQQAALLNAPKL
jgi:hypothetical protein